MFDHAHSYDIEIINDPDEPRSLVVDEEEHMRQVQVLGLWHRRTPDLAATACGIPYHSQFCATRPSELVGALCDSCFTDYEMRKARAADAKENDQ